MACLGANGLAARQEARRDGPRSSNRRDGQERATGSGLARGVPTRMTCSSPPSWPTTRSEPTVGGRVGQNLFGNGILFGTVGWGGAPLRWYVGRTPQGDGSQVLVASAPGRKGLGCGHGLTERVAAGGFDAVSRPVRKSGGIRRSSVRLTPKRQASSRPPSLDSTGRG